MIFEKVDHLDNIRELELAAAEVVKHVDFKRHVANHDDVVKKRRFS